MKKIIKKRGRKQGHKPCMRKMNPNRELSVSGNRTIGYRLAIPLDAYLNAMQPRAYTCAAMQDGTLVYQPVHP
jgi:hypothetical protein